MQILDSLLSFMAWMWGQPDNMGGQFVGLLLSWFVMLPLIAVLGAPSALLRERS